MIGEQGVDGIEVGGYVTPLVEATIDDLTEGPARFPRKIDFDSIEMLGIETERVRRLQWLLRRTEKMNHEGVFAVHVDGVVPVDFFPGVRKRTLLSSDSPIGTRILVVEIDPGHRFLELDVHQPGPEEVYVLEGTFHDGAREYPASSFIHNTVGSSHIPQSATGCNLLPFFRKDRCDVLVGSESADGTKEFDTAEV